MHLGAKLSFRALHGIESFSLHTFAGSLMHQGRVKVLQLLAVHGEQDQDFWGMER
jgi:hypothetical protein